MRKILLLITLLLFLSSTAFAASRILDGDWTVLYDNGGVWSGYIWDDLTYLTSNVGVDLTVTQIADGTWNYVYKFGTSYTDASLEKTFGNMAFTFNTLSGSQRASALVNAGTAIISGAGIWNNPVVSGRRYSSLASTPVKPSESNQNTVIFAFNSNYAPEVGSTLKTIASYGSNIYSGYMPGPNYGVQYLSGYGMPPVDVVPEPASIAFGVMGLVSVLGLKKFKK